MRQKLQDKLDGKTATKPWANEEARPWAPDYMRVTKKKPGFRCRWFRRDRVEQATMQGWVLADRKDYGDVTDNFAGENTQISSQLHRRELVLMEIPEEKAQQREAYYEGVAKRNELDAKQRVRKAAQDIAKKLNQPIQVTDES